MSTRDYRNEYECADTITRAQRTQVDEALDSRPVRQPPEPIGHTQQNACVEKMAGLPYVQRSPWFSAKRAPVDSNVC